MTRIFPFVAALAAVVPAGCSRPADDQPGAVTADESRQLNEAAEMLDANSVDLNALDSTSNGTDPS
ncbi:hypothetical protein D9601_01645 [Sphingomonas sp. MA1305]|uniref:hypothetical protein n=1 Tax=Sphingomonas sp. MA1305 TaxID=2479204 RepID=UPI0018DFB96C|nr:hypothetical protein [Sphingomonas sp. MA1305]MBI0474069.1 hypothetical protein [Sphingomonas sp. MA1305]